MTEPLNILMICHHKRSKAYARPQAMASHLVRRGHRVTLIVIAEHRKFGIVENDWEGVRIIETPDLLWGRMRSGWDPFEILWRSYFLANDKSQYDLIHCFETRPATIYPALFCKKMLKIPMLTDWNDWFGRGGIITILRPKWYQLLLGGVETYYEEAFRTKAEGTTVISTALAQRAASLGVDPDRIRVIHGGTRPEKYQVHPKEECRQRMNLPNSTPVVCFISGDSHLDIELIFASIKKMASKYPEVILFITGKTENHVQNQAAKFGISENLYLTGFVPLEELSWYMGCADIFILPFPDTIYNVGRWPNKLGDYLCVGRPIITNPVGDIKTLFQNYEIGLFADYCEEDFCNKMIYLIEHPEISSRFGENARKIAVNLLDWNIKVKDLENFYYQILNQNTHL